MFRLFRLPILTASIALLTSVTANANSGNLCADVFSHPSTPFSTKLKARLDENLAQFDTQLDSMTNAFYIRLDKHAAFSLLTLRKLKVVTTRLRSSEINPTTFMAFENKLTRIFSQDDYFRDLTARYKSTIGAASFRNSFREQFADLIRDGYSVDVALIELQRRVDKQLPEDAAHIAAAINQLSEILHVFRHQPVYRFLGSSESKSYFWGPLDSLEAMKTYHQNLLQQVRNRFQSRMSPYVIERLRKMRDEGDADIDTLVGYAKFLSLSKGLSPNAPLAVLPSYENEFQRIRKRIGATSEMTPAQLNQIINRLWRNEPYEMTLAVLFEEGPQKNERLKNLSYIGAIIDIAAALETPKAFGFYAVELAKVKRQKKESSVRDLE